MNFNFLDFGNLIYTLFILLVGICTMATYGRTNGKIKRTFIFLVVLYCLIAGLRSKWVGSDTSNYLFYFDYVQSLKDGNILSEFALRDPIAMIFFKYLE